MHGKSCGHAAVLMHGCVVWLPRGGAFFFCPQIERSRMWLLCLETLLPPHCSGESVCQQEWSLPSLFTSVCEQRNVKAVAYLQNSSLVTFPDDMLTLKILPEAEIHSVAHSFHFKHYYRLFINNHWDWMWIYNFNVNHIACAAPYWSALTVYIFCFCNWVNTKGIQM